MNINGLFDGTATLRRAPSQSLAVLGLLLLSCTANAQTVLPTDAAPKCIVQPDEFAKWFKSGSVASNGRVVPADGVVFASNSLCAFYKWSEQMFLWLTSPEGSGFVFSSPTFYAVSPADANNKRTLTPASPDRPFHLSARISQRGSGGQEVVFDSTGKIHDVVRPKGKLLTLDKAGQEVEVRRVESVRDGKPVLLDYAGKPIDLRAAPSGAPTLRGGDGATFSAQASTVLVNGRPSLVTMSGNVIDTEQGQAGGGVLIAAQNDSLVYYLLQVNNVFAYFKTGVQNGKISPVQTQFPTTQDLLDKVTTVARNAPPPHTLPPGQQIPDGKALAMEVKSSWIETKNLPNPGDYLTIDATVPTFTKTDTKWTFSGTDKVKLALVGMHVVGTAKGHPEMIWATFEHINNAPNAPYTYNTSNGPVAGPPAGPGPWLFSKTGASTGPITRRVTVDPTNPENFIAVSGQTIGATDVYRQNAWGTASTDVNFASNNTDIISINNSVLSKLMADDVRKKYLLIGAIWTINGQPPTPANHIGTNALANSTMETFLQGSSCLSCHRGNMLGSKPGPDGFSGGLSHIWDPIKPLFP
jgi:hypothetical protein